MVVTGKTRNFFRILVVITTPFQVGVYYVVIFARMFTKKEPDIGEFLRKFLILYKVTEFGHLEECQVAKYGQHLEDQMAPPTQNGILVVLSTARDSGPLIP